IPGSDHAAITRSARNCCPRFAPSSAAMSSSHADTSEPRGRSLAVASAKADAVRADSCVLVIFGASGDLTHRKLLPAIYNLAESGHLPEQFAVLGVARHALDEAMFR